MFFISLLISVFGPLGAGKLMERLRFRRVFRELLALGPGSSKDKVSDQTKSVVLAKPEKEVAAGWMVLGAVLTANVLLSTSLATLFCGIALTAGFGLNRMFRNRKNSMEKGEYEGAKEALREMLEYGTAEMAEGMAKGFYDSGNEALQRIAVQAMSSWASDCSVVFLKAAEESEFHEIAIMARKGGNAVKRLLAENGEAKMADLVRLRNQARYWSRLGPSLQAASKAPLLLSDPNSPRLDTDELHRAFRHQADLVAHYPHVFCLRCRTRGEQHTHANWTFVICKTCQEADQMLAGVQTVSGQIGPQTAPILSNGVLPINLWDVKENAANPAEINRLDILAGGEFKYDWAVSSSVEAIRNRFPDRELKLEVNIAPGVSLGPNTMNLIRSISNGLGSGLY